MRPLIRQFPAIAISAGALLVALTGFATASPTASTAGVTPAQVRTIAKAVANERILRLRIRTSEAVAVVALS